MNELPLPEDRTEELFYALALGEGSGDLPQPESRIDHYLKYLIENGGGGGAAWGHITGDLEDQTDLDIRFKNAENQIDNLKNLGRFLSIWDCTTGLPTTEPPRGVPFDYSVGDYFRVGNVGTTNYKPNGSQYTGDASITEETDTVMVGAVYYYDGEEWAMQAAGAGGTVQDVKLGGRSIIYNGIADIPVANSVMLGVVKVEQTFGITKSDSDRLQILKATDSEIRAKSTSYKPIVPANLQLAVDTGVKGSANYTSFSCEMSDGTTKTLKLYAELV